MSYSILIEIMDVHYNIAIEFMSIITNILKYNAMLKIRPNPEAIKLSATKT